MAATSGDSTLELTLPVSTRHTLPATHDDVEGEVLELFDACRDGVYRYALSLGMAPSDAEDVVQEVFLALFRHLVRSGGRTNLRGWVFRVTRNISLKRRAGENRFAKVFAVPATLCERVDPSEDPEAQLIAYQRHTRLRAVVEALPDRDRACLRLRAEGLRYREIASALGVSLGTVASSLARTLVKAGRVDAHQH